MVNFIKPSFLGTEREFANLYQNPIKNGQHKDSSKQEIKYMKQRSFVLHRKLSKFVQRREAAVLKAFLPDKFEYVLFIPMTDVQIRLYEYFLANNPLKIEFGGKSLIPDYTFLRKIWTHPKVLENAWQNACERKEKQRVKQRKTIIDSDDDVPDDLLDSQAGNMSVTSDWWRSHILPEDLVSLHPSNKLRVMFEILKLCAACGEKCLIFSAFVAVLNVVEYFMKLINEKDEECARYGIERFDGPWVLGQDYYRLDGKTPKTVRHAMITKFNDSSNRRTKCFLISSRAGGQGINLIGANRVIILDTSWNPSSDQQNIFRVFRLGQKKPCFIYRLLAMGTMEEKVYSRSVTKQAMSFRVVDEQQIDRHYNMAELAELYTLTKTDMTQRPTPVRPADHALSSLLHNFPELVYKFHEHDSLLENKPDQDLSEMDKAEAWAAYEKDVSQTRNMVNGMLGDQFAGLPGLGGMDLTNPGMSPAAAAAAAAAANYRMGSGMNSYPYGYTNKYGSYGIMNGAAYASNLMSYLNTQYPQNLVGNFTPDPNLLRMSQMFPYGNLTGSPPGDQSPIGGASGYGSPSNYFGANLASSAAYYKSPTPPSAPSSIRPMTGGFKSMSDVTNYLASPTGNTPPPPIPTASPLSLASGGLPGILRSSSTSSASPPVLSSSTPTAVTSANFMSVAEDGNIWKKYFEQVSSIGLYPSSKSLAANSLLANSGSGSSSTTSHAKDLTNKIINLHNLSSSSLNQTSSGSSTTSSTMTATSTAPILTTTSHGPGSPSIPTSVITKPSPKSMANANVTTTNSNTTTSKSSPTVITQPAKTHRDQYSPPRHVVTRPVSKTSTGPASTSAVTITPTTMTPSEIDAAGVAAAQTVVKNINMGIVYPKTDGVATTSPSSLLSNSMKAKTNTIAPVAGSSTSGPQKMMINKNVTATPMTAKSYSDSFKQATIYQKGKTTITSPSSLSSVKPTVFMKASAKQSAQHGKLNQSKLFGAALQMINDLPKGPGLSITPVPSTMGSSNSGTTIKPVSTAATVTPMVTTTSSLHQKLSQQHKLAQIKPVNTTTATTAGVQMKPVQFGSSVQIPGGAKPIQLKVDGGASVQSGQPKRFTLTKTQSISTTGGLGTGIGMAPIRLTGTKQNSINPTQRITMPLNGKFS